VRKFLLIANKAATAPFKLNDLAGSAGRMDIVCRCVSSSLFLSHGIRKDTEFHVVLLGPPNPPKHISFYGSSVRRMGPDERNIASFISKTLSGKKFPGVELRDEGVLETIEAIEYDEGFLLEMGGKDLREIEFLPNRDYLFVLGDHLGIPEEILKYLKTNEFGEISVGPLKYFSSHCIVMVHNEMDRRFCS